MKLILRATLVFIPWLGSTQAQINNGCGTEETFSCGAGDCVSNILRAGGVIATSPDGYTSDTGVGWEAPDVITGDESTYWDQQDGMAGPHILQFTSFTDASVFDGYSFSSYGVNNYSPKSWLLMCDDGEIDSVSDYNYTSSLSEYHKCFGQSYQCTTVKFIINTWYSGSPVIKEFRLSASSSYGPITVAPTTEAQVFLAKNFTIGSPQVTYMDVNGEPQFHFLYKVGASVASLRFSLFREGCTSTKNVTDILTLRNESDGNGTYSKLISVDPTEIQGSPLVIPELGLKGFSAGIINFCVKAEVLMGKFSVEFLKSEVSLAYDLSNNTFSIDIVTEAKEVEKFNRTSDFGYGVDVCQCLVTGYDCSTAAFNIKQGELVAICLSPNNKSKNVTQISKFSMDFNQNKILQYTAATIGASGTEPGALSLLQSSGHTQKVLSRMVTELYDGGATFNVTGVAYLRFKNKRLLAAVKTQNIRRIQAPEVSDEDAPFRLSIGIEKTKVVDNKATMDPLTILIVASVTIALTLVFCVYKKFA